MDKGHGRIELVQATGQVHKAVTSAATGFPPLTVAETHGPGSRGKRPTPGRPAGSVWSRGVDEQRFTSQSEGEPVILGQLSAIASGFIHETKDR